MIQRQYSEEELTEICEDAFVNVKEACKRLQERTGCSNQVVIAMLANVADFYQSQDQQTRNNDPFRGIEGLKA